MSEPIAWTTSDLMEALSPALPGTLPQRVFSGISTDSRTMGPGEIFLALRGERFDGHRFVPDLLEKGVRGFVVDKAFMAGPGGKIRQETADALFLEVDDTLAALGKLARFQRVRAGVRVLAITGSSGKTTTKEMAGAVFNTRFNTLVTQGNLNNEIGVPLTLLKLSKDHDWAVVEMGMNHPGEIERLAAIALPDMGIITNTAAVHLEGVGTVEDVARAKAELLGGIGGRGISILNLDDPRYCLLRDKALENRKIHEQITFGFSEDALVRAADIETKGGEIRFTLWNGMENMGVMHLDTPGRFMVENALAAAASALAAGIDKDEIALGLGRFRPGAGRLNVKALGRDIKVIDDSYNANPLSVACALETLAELGRDRQIVAVLGDMLELGRDAPRLHREVGKKVAACGVSRLYVHGEMGVEVISGAVAEGVLSDHCLGGTHEEISDHIRTHVEPGAWILIKGSRGMKMERVVDLLEDSDGRRAGCGTR